MKKRFLAFMVFMSVLCMAFSAFADDLITGTCGESMTWTYDSSTQTLTISGTGAMYNYDEVIQNYGVIAPWRKNSSIKDNLEKVVISEGVTSIGTYAFFYCSNITNITIPSSIKTIGDSAFYSCSGLTSITIPDGVTSIDDEAFSYCTGLTSVTIPGSVISIGDSAFSYCDALTRTTISNGVKSIGEFAFYDCGNLTSIIIPDSVTSIGDNAFWYTAYYKDTSKWENDVLYIGNHLIKAESITGEYVIKSETKSIAEYAFYYCNELTSITIPDSVVGIGDHAFDSCNGLTGITIPKSVTRIGDYAFYTCSKLASISVDGDNTAYCSENGILYNKEKTEIIRFPRQKTDTVFTIPKGVTGIAAAAFEFCEALTSITIPESVKSIGDSAFEDCYALTSITIPDGVPSIGNKTCYGCESLTNVTIPNSVISIGEQAFKECTSLNKVYYIGSEADWTAIKKGSYYSISNSIIEYCKGISATRSDNGKITVRPINTERGKTVILALYDGGKIIEIQSEVCDGTEITFTPNKNYTYAKVIVWESLADMSPVCGIKVVE